MWLVALNLQRADLASAVGWLIQRGRVGPRDGARVVALPLPLARRPARPGAHVDDAAAGRGGRPRRGSCSRRAEAIALYFTRAIAFWQQQDVDLVGGLTRSAELFAESGDASGEALARVSSALARLAATTPDVPGAIGELERSLDRLPRRRGPLGRGDVARDDGAGAARRGAGGCRGIPLRGEPRARDRRGRAARHRDRAEPPRLGAPAAAATSTAPSGTSSRASRSRRPSGHDEGVAYGLEGLVAVAAQRGDAARAGELAGRRRVAAAADRALQRRRLLVPRTGHRGAPRRRDGRRVRRRRGPGPRAAARGGARRCPSLSGRPFAGSDRILLPVRWLAVRAAALPRGGRRRSWS